MTDREYDLIEIIRDPGLWVYEAWELTAGGHYYLYHYDSREGAFTRATVPAGAAAVQFFPLKSSEHVPLSGWRRIEKRSMPPFRPHVITSRVEASP